jgi:hypothetical protein
MGDAFLPANAKENADEILLRVRKRRGACLPTTISSIV